MEKIDGLFNEINEDRRKTQLIYADIENKNEVICSPCYQNKNV